MSDGTFGPVAGGAVGRSEAVSSGRGASRFTRVALAAVSTFISTCDHATLTLARLRFAVHTLRVSIKL